MKKLVLSWVLMMAVVSTLFAQTRQVTGKVTSSEDGSGMSGVSVSAKGSSKGTSTAADGTYKIAVADGASLVFSFVGFNSQNVSVGSRSVIDVQLQADNQQLSEVVVVGYGTKKRQEFTGKSSIHC
jgi:pseudouridine-5'-phosphate glycosidase